MKRTVILPNIVTAFSLSCGLFVIFKMNMIPPGGATYDHVFHAVLILLLAAFLDLLDGALARAMKVESAFGGLFDSLSDAVSFGVAPSVVILKALSVESNTLLFFVLTAAAMIYSISGVLRLVRFTVTNQKLQADQKEAEFAKASFTGLPIPASASVALSTTLFLMSPDAVELFSLGLSERAWIAASVFIVLGYFMISRWKFPSVKNLQLRVSSFQIVLVTGIIAAIILLSVTHHFAALFAGISWAYLFIAWVLSLVRIVAGRKNKALEDFEPDAEDDQEE